MGAELAQDPKRAHGEQLTRTGLLTELQAKGVLNIIPQARTHLFEIHTRECTLNSLWALAALYHSVCSQSCENHSIDSQGDFLKAFALMKPQGTLSFLNQSATMPV